MNYSLCTSVRQLKEKAKLVFWGGEEGWGQTQDKVIVKVGERMKKREKWQCKIYFIYYIDVMFIKVCINHQINNPYAWGKCNTISKPIIDRTN